MKYKYSYKQKGVFILLEIYTAGFLDADGTVRLTKHNSKCEEYTRYPIVEFFNCDISILEKIQQKWGGKIKGKQSKQKNQNVSYTLSISYDAAINLLEDVYPFMIHSKKRERTRLIIENYKKLTPRNGKYSESQKEQKIKLINSVMSIIMRGHGAY